MKVYVHGKSVDQKTGREDSFFTNEVIHKGNPVALVRFNSRWRKVIHKDGRMYIRTPPGTVLTVTVVEEEE